MFFISLLVLVIKVCKLILLIHLVYLIAKSTLKAINMLLRVIHKIRFRLVSWPTLKAKFIRILLVFSQRVVPSLYIHHSSWRMKDFISITLNLLWNISMIITLTLQLVLYLLLNQKRRVTTAFLGGSKVILEQLVHVVLVYNHAKLLVL